MSEQCDEYRDTRHADGNGHHCVLNKGHDNNHECFCGWEWWNNRMPHDAKVWRMIGLYTSDPYKVVYFGECSCGFSIRGENRREVESSTHLHRAYEEGKANE